MRQLAALGLLSTLPLPAFAQAKGELVLYTSQLIEDARQTVAAFEQAQPGVKVRWVRDGTTQLLAKLRAEFAAGDPQPDVLLIADDLSMAGLKREGRLQPYLSPQAAQLPAAVRHAEGCWTGTKLITTGIAYNTAATLHPASWWDLKQPAANGQIMMPSPMYSGAAMAMMLTFAQHAALGWPYYDMLAAQHTIAQGGNGGVFKSVSGGSKLYGVLVDFLVIRAARKGAPLQFVFPSDGVSAVTEPVALLKTAKNLDAARAFVDFVLSKPGQTLVAQQGMMPARGDVAPPPGFPKLADIKLLNLDAERALDEQGAAKQRFAELFA